MTLLFGSGNSLRMERGFAVGRTDVTKRCCMPKACDVDGFTDWFKVGHYCVKYFNTSANFTDAEFSCMKIVPGGHLVSVHNKEDNEHLKNINSNNQRVWLGGFRLFQTDKFRWTDGSYWDYESWVPGEPKQEECVEMNWNVTGKWNDDHCKVAKSYFCAFKLNAV
ncbi:hypothetical protein ABG768_000793 [Culter alburnus]|uniref:C-type lectin domain-containing protein n=1 Tax=Culter alburnus TaxID=194366 RepID=A0AAW2BAS4_CULAL